MSQRIPNRIASRVTRRLELRKRTFFLLERLGTHDERYRAFDPSAGPDGDQRVIHVLPRSKTSMEHIGVLQRLSKGNSITNLPVIHGYCPLGDKIYVVLPWVHGRSLQEHLAGARQVDNQGHKGIAVSEAVKLFTGFAHGMAHLNRRKNMVHGDLKPANLVVHPGPNRLVMIDYGSAWLVERTKVRGPRDGVDHHYGAPELHAGGFADFRSDLFSACVIFYEMLTLELPYGGIGGQAGLPQFREAYAEAYVPPSQLCKNRDGCGDAAWKKIDQFISKGLQLDPEKRFRNCREWLDGVDAIRFEMAKPKELSVRAKAAMMISEPLNWLRNRF